MRPDAPHTPSQLAAVLFDLLDPLPFAFFTGALAFDAAYAGSGEILWMKAAAWLIVMGLLAAIVPRFINLARVWSPRSRRAARIGPADRTAFWLHLVGIVVAILNAFVHSRDAYAVIPDGLWLSVATVVLFAAGTVVLTLRPARIEVPA